MQQLLLFALLLGLATPPAAASPRARLACETLRSLGPPALSLAGREAAQFQLIVNRVDAESAAPIDPVALAGAFVDQLEELASCEAARELLPALETLDARVEGPRLFLGRRSGRGGIALVGQLPGRFAEEAVARLGSGTPGEAGRREAADRLAWAAWVQALLLLRGGVGEGYLFADEWRVEPPQAPGLGSVHDDCRAYLRLPHFTAATSGELAEALETIDALGLVELAIDLRGNAGGRLDLEPVELLLSPGSVLARRRDLGAAEVELLRGGRASRPYLIVLLVDGATGSMAELFAATLQAGGATLLGQRTHGKSVGQRRHPVGGEGLLVLDAVEYFHPATGQGWSAGGLQPDVEVATGSPPTLPLTGDLASLASADAALTAALERLGATSRCGRSGPP